MKPFRIAALCLAMSVSAQIATAHEWDMNAGLSDLAFGSVKKETIGEAHHIKFASGVVSHDGNVKITRAVPVAFRLVFDMQMSAALVPRSALAGRGV